MYEATPFQAPSLRQRKGVEYAAHALYLVGYTGRNKNPFIKH